MNLDLYNELEESILYIVDCLALSIILVRDMLRDGHCCASTMEGRPSAPILATIGVFTKKAGHTAPGSLSPCEYHYDTGSLAELVWYEDSI